MSPRSTRTVEFKRLNMTVPVELHNSFKAAAAAEGKSMTNILMEFIRKYVEQHQAKQRRVGGSRK